MVRSILVILLLTCGVAAQSHYSARLTGLTPEGHLVVDRGSLNQGQTVVELAGVTIPPKPENLFDATALVF